MKSATEVNGKDLFVVGFVFELALVLIAAVIGFFATGSAFPFKFTLFDPDWLAKGVGWGLAFTVPPALFGALNASRFYRRIPPLERIYERLREMLGDGLVRMSTAELVLLAAAAGIGEEILFRGVLHPLLGNVANSVIFGLLHAVTPTYFILAAVMSLYLGWVFQFSGDNVLAPIIVHWLYDVVGLIAIRQRIRRDQAAESSQQAAPQ